VIILVATQLIGLLRGAYVLDTHTGATLITILLYLISFYIFSFYDLSRNRQVGNMALRSLVAVGFASGSIALLFYLLPYWKYDRRAWFMQMVLVCILMIAWRRLYAAILPDRVYKRKILILGAGRAGRFFYKWAQNARTAYEVVGFLDDDPAKFGKKMNHVTVLGTTDQLMDIGQREGVTTALIAITHEKQLNFTKKVLEAKFNGWSILDMSREYEKSTHRVPTEHIYDEWLLFAEGFYLLRGPFTQKIKRLTDFLYAVSLLILSSPLLLVTALAIRLESRGPILYRQTRVGKDGKLFELWKFRSMCQDAEENGAVWAQKVDFRVTKVGRWIRLLRIDELPQLYNVLCGQMSLIGPRPERPEFVHELEKVIPYYFVRYTVQPGITGWAQINYRYGASVEDAQKKLEYDLYYIKNMFLFLDIKIILKTIEVVLFGHGAR
jgi:sugar transferase (PEP-CTERM system associated)